MNAFAGHFSDGVNAERRAVRVTLEQAGLAIRNERGEQLVLWPYRDLRLVEHVYRDQPVRLRCSGGGEGRLSVRDQAILDALRPYAGRIRGGDMRGARMLPRALAWTGATALALVGIYFGLPLLAEPVAAVIPREWEERLGQSVVHQVEIFFGRNGKLVECRAPAGRAALERLIARLAGTVKTDYTFRVRVVDSPVVNALAAPGGYIIVFRGLIEKANSAEEVAGVLGHEMGHVIRRHGTAALIRAQGMKIIFGAMAEGSAIDYGTQVLSLSYGRDAEREADFVGISMLNQLDIRGAGFASFFRRLGGDSSADKSVFRYISTHPPTGERAATIEARAIGRGDAMSADEWRALRDICSVKN